MAFCKKLTVLAKKKKEEKIEKNRNRSTDDPIIEVINMERKILLLRYTRKCSEFHQRVEIYILKNLGKYRFNSHNNRN